MTATRDLYRQHEQRRRVMEQTLEDVARSEFPRGARVCWIRTFTGPNRSTPVYQSGFVVEHGGDYGFRWELRADSGVTHKRHPWELEPAPPK